jgi:hypothetical protein
MQYDEHANTDQQANSLHSAVQPACAVSLRSVNGFTPRWQ